MLHMLDTTVFYKLCEGDNSALPIVGKGQVFITEAQMAELRKCKDLTKRENLLKMVEVLNAKELETVSAIWGRFKWGEKPWGQSGGHYDAIRQDLEKWKKKDKGNINDALIAEVCIVKDLTLITYDKALAASLNAYKPGMAILLAHPNSKSKPV